MITDVSAAAVSSWLRGSLSGPRNQAVSCFVTVWCDGSVSSSTGGGAVVEPSVPRKEQKQRVGGLDLVEVTQLEQWLVSGGV